jgi:hypothetical protein
MIGVGRVHSQAEEVADLVATVVVRVQVVGLVGLVVISAVLLETKTVVAPAVVDNFADLVRRAPARTIVETNIATRAHVPRRSRGSRS